MKFPLVTDIVFEQAVKRQLVPEDPIGAVSEEAKNSAKIRVEELTATIEEE